jgi:hypothetical protein
LPNAIRGTLNKAAFDVKQDTMPRSANREFVKRSPNFLKANSRVDMAKGYNIDSMAATVGFTEENLQGQNFAVKDLEQQERGGNISGRSFIPTSIARGGSNSRVVANRFRMDKLKNKIVNATHAKGKNPHEKFIKSAIHAGKGGYVIANNILWRIDSITSRKVRIIGRYSATRVKSTPIYSFEKGRSVHVEATGFMRRASLETAAKLDEFYIEEAKRQIQRLNR